MYSRTLLTI